MPILRGAVSNGGHFRMTITSHDPHYAAKAREANSRRPITKPAGPRRQRGQRAATVSWYGSLLIVGTLFVAANWELFRLILAIVTLD